MPNPLIDQGSLTRLRATVVVPSIPTLNVTAPYLGVEGIKLTVMGETVLYMPSLTGAVISLEPYVMVEMEVNLLKSQALANLYKQQLEFNSLLGNITLRGDAVPLGAYNFNNCSIKNVRPLDFSGKHPNYTLTIGGVYYINAIIYN